MKYCIDIIIVIKVVIKVMFEKLCDNYIGMFVLIKFYFFVNCLVIVSFVVRYDFFYLIVGFF